MNTQLKFDWKSLNRRDKTSIITAAMMRHIFINGNCYRIGMREINVNIGKYKSNLRIDILEINKRKNFLVGYEVKSCIQDFRTDKKWESYLDLINQLYFVFDNETYEKHQEEILEKIGNKAGVYTYNPVTNWVSFRQGGKAFIIPDKQEDFYRTILFNYLFRKAQYELNKGVTR